MSVTSDALKYLMTYSYPGNVRELENIIERGVALATGDTIDVDLFPTEVAQINPVPPASDEAMSQSVQLDDLLARYERGLIEVALDEAGGNRTKSADLLGVSLRSLRYLLEKFGMAEA